MLFLNLRVHVLQLHLLPLRDPLLLHNQLVFQPALLVSHGGTPQGREILLVFFVGDVIEGVLIFNYLRALGFPGLLLIEALVVLEILQNREHFVDVLELEDLFAAVGVLVNDVVEHFQVRVVLLFAGFLLRLGEFEFVSFFDLLILNFGFLGVENRDFILFEDFH